MGNQGATFYDGVPNNSVVGKLVNMVPSPDTVSEFRVQTNSNSAEYGRYSGGVINISSKSGTNQFHGAAYEYFRNTALDANLFFNNSAGIGKAPVHQHQYGANLGGPVKKNKLFFFGWENYFARQGANYVGTVPLPAMYNGDFSGYRNASNAIIPIYDPLTQCGTNGKPLLPGWSCGSVVQRRGGACAVPRQHHSGRPVRPDWREDTKLSGHWETQRAGGAVHGSQQP